MSSKRVRIMLLSGLALIAVIIVIGLALIYGSDRTTSAPLPGPDADVTAGPEPSGGGSAPNNSGLNIVAVTPGNVQAVIKRLSRQENYVRHVRIENFYSGGSAVYEIDVTVNGSESALTIDGPEGVKHIILAGGRYYIWYDDDKQYLNLPAEALGEEQSVSDQYQMMLTYEDILELDAGAITDAGYTADGGAENSIYVKYVSGVLKYTSECRISLASGLLTDAEQYDGGVLVYRMTSSDYVESAADNAAFNLPDGKNALSVP